MRGLSSCDEWQRERGNEKEKRGLPYPGGAETDGIHQLGLRTCIFTSLLSRGEASAWCIRWMSISLHTLYIATSIESSALRIGCNDLIPTGGTVSGNN
jgi:hypothetical protein